MITAFGFTVVLLALIFLFSKVRKHGLGDSPLWFIASSLVFVNFGFLLTHCTAKGAGVAWTADGLLVVSLGLLSFISGALLRSSLPHRAPRLVRPERSEVKEPDRARLVVVAGLVLVPAWLYFALLGYVPLFDGLAAVADQGLDGLGQLQASRLSRDAYASAKGVYIPFQGVLQLARNLGAPIVAAYAAAQMARSGFSKTSLAVLAFATVTLLLAGQRWPMIYLAVAVIAAMSLSGIEVRPKRFFQVGIGVLILGISVSVLQSRTRSQASSWLDAFTDAWQNLLGRIFLEQSAIPIASYQFKPFGAGELLGRSYLDSLRAYAPGPGESFPVEFFRAVTGTSTGYTAPPDFYTEAYINFGLVGVIIISAFWGMALGSLKSRTFSTDDTLNVGLQAGLVAIVSQSCFSGPVFTLSGFIIVYAISQIVKLFTLCGAHFTPRPNRPSLRLFHNEG